MKNTQWRPAKKLTFDDKPGTAQRRALLSDHLSMVEANRDMKNTMRQTKITEEREEIQNIMDDLKNNDELTYD